MAGWCISRFATLLLLLLDCHGIEVRQEIINVWPTPMMSLKPAVPGLTGNDNERAFRKRLAKVGAEGFDHYVEKILPQELQLDSEWRETYETMDGSRNNHGFVRWQKKVTSLRKRMSVREFNWDGSRVPKYKGVAYDWPALYDSDDYQRFINVLTSWSSKFLEKINDRREKLRIHVWAEVFKPGDFLLPHQHTGAPVSGIFVARSNRKQELVFQDERGKLPPFGQERRVPLVSGDLHVFPSWAQNYFTRNEGNSTNTFFGFWGSFVGSTRDFDWEDDPSGDLIVRKENRLKARHPEEQRASPASTRAEL